MTESQHVKYKKIIADYSAEAYKKLTRSPMGELKYPFLVPGAQYTYQLWDWDSWLTDVAIRQIISDSGGDADASFAECERGCIHNFLSCIDDEGKCPIVIDGEKEVFFFKDSKNIHKPNLAQHLAFLVKSGVAKIEDFDEAAEKLEIFVGWYKKNAFHKPTGLYLFSDDTAIGVDNDPCIFYRPDGSTASIYLNCLMYKELRAMAYLLESAGCSERAEDYDMEAARLKDSINEHLYDEKCGMYYSADVNLLPVDMGKMLHSGCPRHWNSLIMRIDSWSGFMALWAGIASPKQAERVIFENMLCERTFKGKYGIRSLSKLEKMYANIPSGNPSCWLGPMWVIANYMCFRGLVRYGYENEARELAQTVIGVLGMDIENTGQMHEYYHCDTGEGINGPGFQSWNLLVNNMIAYLDGRETVEEF